MGLASCRGAKPRIALRQRAAFAARHDASIPDLSDAALLARLDEWLAPLLHGKRRLDAVGRRHRSTMRSRACSAMRRAAPSTGSRRPISKSPAGSSHPIDYAAPGGPTVEVRAQALYGLKDHPMVAGGRVPLTLAITSPAHRPIQTTKDLPAFWAGSWRDVAKEMRGRYPKHPWPDDPAARPADAAHQARKLLIPRPRFANRTLMTVARIIEEQRKTTQSGKAQDGRWTLEFERQQPQRPDPLTGWNGSGDTKTQVRLRFDTQGRGAGLCRAQGLHGPPGPGAAGQPEAPGLRRQFPLGA